MCNVTSHYIFYETRFPEEAETRARRDVLPFKPIDSPINIFIPAIRKDRGDDAPSYFRSGAGS